MSVEEFGDTEVIRMKEEEEKQRIAELEKPEVDPEEEEEADRKKKIEWDAYCDEVPKGWGNTKRL